MLPAIQSATPGRAPRWTTSATTPIAWTLTAHEARPGHELQFARMTGARRFDGARRVRVQQRECRRLGALRRSGDEGISARGRAHRFAADAHDARSARVPRSDVESRTVAAGAGAAFPDGRGGAVRADGQAGSGSLYVPLRPARRPSYYYGYTRFNALRTRVELAQAGRFNELAFHDFIVNQGLLPFDLLEQAVTTEFVPSRPSSKLLLGLGGGFLLLHAHRQGCRAARSCLRGRRTRRSAGW